MAEPIKLLLLGESGAGKTCALASLLGAGYNVNILDFDNGVDALVNLVKSPKSPYPKDSLSRLSYITLTEPMHSIGGNIVPKAATVWPRYGQLLNNWVSEKPEPKKLGSVLSWGDKDVLVIDTLGSLGTAALNHHMQANGNLGKSRSQMEFMRDSGGAQAYLRSLLELIRDTSFKCNIIVCSHITWAKPDGSAPNPDKDKDIILSGYPKAIGKKIVPEIPGYFNHMLLIKSLGTTKYIFTVPTDNINLKSGAPLNVLQNYKADTGLAEYFKTVREAA